MNVGEMKAKIKDLPDDMPITVGTPDGGDYPYILEAEVAVAAEIGMTFYIFADNVPPG